MIRVTHRSIAHVAIAGFALAASLLSYPAQAAPTPVVDATATASVAAAPAVKVARASKKGSKGQRLTVTPTRGLSSYGQTITVKGRGFSELVGIYVGLCVKPRRGAKPTPCGGGMDQTGSTHASAWISSNPPPYGRGLAIPYKPGGRFSVTIRVSPIIGSYDCRTVKCVVVARADHLRASDRTWDVLVPVTFS